MSPKLSQNQSGVWCRRSPLWWLKWRGETPKFTQDTGSQESCFTACSLALPTTHAPQLCLSAKGCVHSSYHNPTSSLFRLGCQEAKPSSLLPRRPLCFLRGAPEVAYSAQHRPRSGPCPTEGEKGDLHLSRPRPTAPHFLEARPRVLPVYQSGEGALWLST